MMKEDKQVILDMLVDVLQHTDNLHDLVSLEYLEEREFVKATFASGDIEYANVTMDSDTALICDVIEQIL